MFKCKCGRIASLCLQLQYSFAVYTGIVIFVRTCRYHAPSPGPSRCGLSRVVELVKGAGSVERAATLNGSVLERAGSGCLDTCIVAGSVSGTCKVCWVRLRS